MRPVAIIDELLAQRLFPGESALGRRIREAGHGEYSRKRGDGLPPEMEIVGICSSHRHSLWQETPAAVYVPFASSSGFKINTYLLVKYAPMNSAALAAAIEPLRAALRILDPDLPIVRVIPFDALIETHIPFWMARLAAVLFSVFGAVALLLAMIGLYGVKAYAVARRTREIGIRLALGAPPRAAFALIFRQALLQTALALAIGSLLALAAGRLLDSFVYRIGGTDPIALTGAALLLAIAALAACWLPAYRAARIDPMIALRNE
jgi:ABC-type antimicrobial peptide transport system permease subunit